ncbi:hypothetical protein O3P69_014355 [Scylla paramamosain]|uniref:Uncharacterized protein n=1 Tax=Scylla paramamosain TaxID=85552 RepID=A0AAW0TDP7_SCYPA
MYSSSTVQQMSSTHSHAALSSECLHLAGVGSTGVLLQLNKTELRRHVEPDTSPSLSQHHPTSAFKSSRKD